MMAMMVMISFYYGDHEDDNITVMTMKIIFNEGDNDFRYQRHIQPPIPT